MRIAFDLDDTLIACRSCFPAEEPSPWARWLVHEPLRKGTVRVMKRLIGQGHEVWIYTTSLRRPAGVKWLFLAHGVRIRGVINGERHHRVVARSGEAYRACSKYPPAFGIDLLVDDLEGVGIEARRHGFRAIIVRPDDENWAAHLLAEIGKVSGSRIVLR